MIQRREPCSFKISPTGINIYRKCPRKFFYYIKRYPSLMPPFREALGFGSLIHNIIKDYYMSIPDDIVPGEVKIYVKNAMQKNWSPTFEPFRERLEKQLLNFIRFEKSRLSWHINPKPVAVEKEFERKCVHGIVDAMFRKDDKVIIVDWKTGKGQADLTEDIIVQLNVYMWLTGADEAYALFLEYGNFRKLTRTIDVEDLVETVLTDRRYVPRSGKHCEYCEYQVRCLYDRGLLKIPTLWWVR